MKLIDRYGRRINYLRISVTDRCNLRCIYCMPESGIVCKRQHEILSYEEILKIVQVGLSLGINKIRITGGEPLVRKDIIKFISTLLKLKGIYDLSLTTNGVLLSEYAKDLFRLGLRRINISLDTLDKEKYKIITKTGNLDKVLEGINKAIKFGFEPVKINVVVMKNINEDEVIEFAKLTFKEPLHVRFIEFMPIGQGIISWQDKFISNVQLKQYCESIGELQEIKNFSNSTTSSIYKFRNAKGTISFISPISDPFCSKCCRLRLTSDGKLRLCLGSDKEINLMQIVRNSTSEQVCFNKLRQQFLIASYLKPKQHTFNSVFSEIFTKNAQTKINMTMCEIGG